MQKKVIEFNQSQRSQDIDLRAGDVVKVHRKIKEGDKERIQIFEGMIIAVKGGQSSSKTITVRKVSNGVGVEIIIPVLSPGIEKIEMVKRAKVRRSKLYYVRERAAKALRFKFTDMSDQNIDNEIATDKTDKTTTDDKEVSEDPKEDAEDKNVKKDEKKK